MLLSERDILRFAEWSHDRNPLHVDPRAANYTFFGQCIAHGMLSAIAAIAEAGSDTVDTRRAFELEFRGAIMPGTAYEVSTVSDQAGVSTTTVSRGDAVSLVIATGRHDGSTESDADWTQPLRDARETTSPLRTEPATQEPETFVPGLEVTGRYATGPIPDEYLAGGRLRPIEARVFALCSYIIGMEVPGLRSLFTRAVIHVAAVDHDFSTLLYRVQVLRFDEHFRMLDLALDVAGPDGTPVASAELRAYVRFSPIVTDPALLQARLTADASSLGGKTALVCGGTRGLGADLTTALAMAGCHVVATYHRDEDAARQLVERLAGHHVTVECLRGDAADAGFCRDVRDRILASRRRLDLLVLNACAPPAALRVGAATGAFGDYIDRNVRLAATPLHVFLDSLRAAGGALLAVSSSFVDELPAGFGHYVAVKQAVEAMVRTAVRETPAIHGLIIRPPRLQTSWNDTPTGVPGTIPADWVASHTVNRLASSWEAGQVDLLTDFPPLPRITRPPVAPDAPEFVVALSASFTAEPLRPALRFWFGELGLRGRVDVAPYAQVLQSLLDPGSVLSGSERGANLIFLRVADWLRELPADQASSPDFVRDYLHRTARDLDRALRTHRARAARETLVVVCPSGDLAPEIAPAIAATERAILTSLEGIPGLEVVAAEQWHPTYDVTGDLVHDPVRDHLAHVPFQDAYFHVLATIAMRRLHRRLAPVRKVVVVDCDNTLWRGVVGEVGAEGLAFDDAHRALHATLDRLSRSGVLVCLCSKNEEADVWRVFETRSELGLSRDRIVAAMINWQPKSQNLRTLAARLNLGLDSFIFIDDNPVECAEVRGHCPEVLTLQWPQDETRARLLLRHTWELDVTRATAEDARRTELYQQEFERQQLQDTLTFADFIRSLGLVIDIAPLGPDDLKRASQLTLRTNQFNFTTRRRDEAAMQALVDEGRHEIRTVRVRDRFGDYGLVGLLIAEPHDGRLDVDTFLLSCRVLGRGVEHEMAAELGRLALSHGLPTVRLVVETTKRNTPARNFLESLAPPESRTGDAQRLQCDLAADTLAAFRFEPGDTAPPAVADDGGKTAAVPAAGDLLRHRERQILRAAFELSDPSRLAAAIEGRGAAPVSAPSPSGDADVEATVVTAFASALKLPADQVRSVDRLEALGCDSFKIVEITVALLETFPSLPTTLLFEHPSVSAIVSAIEALVAADAGTSVTTRRAEEAPSAGMEGRLEPATEIAIVGMHVRCAGADSPGQLWQLLSQGLTAVRPVPPDRPYFLGPLADSRPHFAGLLEDVDRFDAELFGISPREAVFMDPQLRLLLEVMWAALEDAGCLDEETSRETGVFIGAMYADYVHHANASSRGGSSPYRSWEGFSLANRVSHLMGFQGPSLAVETACSSSGTALHLACRSLLAGDCRVALVGGVNLILDPDRFAQLGRLGILSASGRCLAFGADADGTVLGEGAAVLVLRPLADAIGRRDRIHGVIRGTGVSTGSGTVGFTAPNPQAQAEAIRRALKAARVDPRTIGYVETHGTGTALGDPIEVRGLALAYQDPELQDARLSAGGVLCRLGSIKPNIGHLEAGAGVVGLVKVLLQLRYGQLVPSISSEKTNPQIPFDQVPFALQRTLEPWTRPTVSINGRRTTAPRRAGLSSFGVGGSNAHVIVEEPPARPKSSAADADRPVHLIAVSARTEEALVRRALDMAAWIERHPEVALPDACFTANTGWRPLDHRLVVIARSPEEMATRLRRAAGGERFAGVADGVAGRAGAPPKVAFLFTGQGSQYAGMGRALYDANPVFRTALDRCAALFEPLIGTPLLPLLFATPGSPEAGLIDQTGYTQPALFAFQYALAELWVSWGVRPAAVLGHSVGEFAAVCLAGGMSLEHALRLVAARGRLMQALPAGGRMTSVMAPESWVAEAILGYEDRVSIAGINAPSQVVISGAGEAIAEIEARLVAEGIRCKPLVVSHAFHSPLMRPMTMEFASAVADVRFQAVTVPVVSGMTGELGGADMTRPDYWVRQVLEPVRFAAAMQTLAAQGIDAYVEIGPHPVLIGLGRQCVPEVDAALWLPSLRRDADGWPTLLESLGRLWASGTTVDWRAFDAPYARHRVSLPAYPFGGRRYWIETTRETAAPSIIRTSAPDTTPERRRGPRLYEVAWREVQPTPVTEQPAGRWLLLAGEDALGGAVAEALRQRGAQVLVVRRGTGFARDGEDAFVVDPQSPAAVDLLGQQVLASGPVRGVVHLWRTAPDDGAHHRTVAATRDAVLALVNLLRAMLAGKADSPRLWLITRDGVASGPDVEVVPSESAIWGLGRTIALEHPETWGGLVDVPGRVVDVRGLADALVAHLLAPGDEDQAALRHGRRLVARLVEVNQPVGRPLPVTTQATYLVTGGVGALGLRAARWLAERGARNLVLASRHGAHTDEQQRAVAAIEALGARVSIERVDLSRRDEVARLVTALGDRTAPLRGIVHAVGVDRLATLRELTAADLDEVIAAKGGGALALHELTRDRPLDFFVCYSSIASLLGSFARGHYAAANALLDGLMARRRASGLAGLSVNWGPWRDGGMATEASLREFERIGNHGLRPDDAMRLLDLAVSADRAHVAVADLDWDTFRPVYESRRRRPVLAEVGAARPLAEGRPPARPSEAAAWIARLASVEPGSRAELLATLVRGEVAQALGFSSPEEVAPDRSFYDQGMDSLVAAELAGRLQGQVGLACTGLLFDHPTVDGLTRELLARVALPGVATAAAPAPVVPGDAAAGKAGAPWLASLAQVAPDERQALLVGLLQDEAARTLGFERGGDVPADRSLLELGMDSLSAAEFGNRLQKQLGVRGAGLVFQHPRLIDLATRLLRDLTVEARETPAPAASSTAPSAGETPASGVLTYSPDLEEAAIAFQRAAWPRRQADLVAPRWRWMVVDSARRLGLEPRVWLYRDNGRIVAHNGAMAVLLHVDGQRLPTAWLVDTMVLEEYRSQAVGSRLMVHAHDDLPFALSLGQTETMRAIQLRLGWHQVAPLQTAQLLVRPERVLKGKLPAPAAAAAGLGFRLTSAWRDLWRGRMDFVVREIEAFGEEHDRLWQAMSREVACAVVRDASYLNWKYVDQPGQSFLRLEARHDGELLAVAVWMVRPADRAYHYAQGFLVDYVGPLADADRLAAMLRATGEVAVERGADALVCFHVGEALTRGLRRAGFMLRDPRRFLLVDPGPLEGATRARVLDATSWLVTHGDSDIDRPW